MRLLMSKDYKKDFHVSLLYRFELSHRKLQYKTPEQKEREYTLKDAGYEHVRIDWRVRNYFLKTFYFEFYTFSIFSPDEKTPLSPDHKGSDFNGVFIH